MIGTRMRKPFSRLFQRRSARILTDPTTPLRLEGPTLFSWTLHLGIRKGNNPDGFRRRLIGRKKKAAGSLCLDTIPSGRSLKLFIPIARSARTWLRFWNRFQSTLTSADTLTTRVFFCIDLGVGPVFSAWGRQSDTRKNCRLRSIVCSPCLLAQTM